MNLPETDKREPPCVFSLSPTQILIANHLDKIVWCGIAFIIIFVVMKIGHFSLYGLLSLIFLCSVPLLFAKLQKKFAYRIVIYFTSRLIQFNMLRTYEIISAGFNDIKDLSVNGCIIVDLESKKILYNDLQNKELLSCLNRIKEIRWGTLCTIWGPDKTVRDYIKGN